MAAQPRPTYAHVAAIRVPEFASRGVGEQAALKERLETLVRESLEGVTPADRVVLDADDGLAVVLFGDAAEALDWVGALAPAAARRRIQVGLNYGPLALTAPGRAGSVFGDGVGAALTAAQFASSGQPLITEDFRRALQAVDPERAQELASAGNFTDARVRQHTFYWHDPQRGAVRRRRRMASRVGIVLVILLLGVVGRDIYKPMVSRPAIVKLDVRPRGEIYVDGSLRGRSPPLTHVDVLPGKHRFQVRLPGQAPYEVVMDLRAGQEATLTYTFPSRAPAQRNDFWNDLKRKFGS